MAKPVTSIRGFLQVWGVLPMIKPKKQNKKNEHRVRDDFSPFLIHLTRDYEKGKDARSNLHSILKAKCIKARNPHCLFGPKIKKTEFPRGLRTKFNTVCLTETPLNQLKFLTRDIKGRNINLQPYGVVFWKDHLLARGANPALYINSQAGKVRDFLLSEFDRHFDNQKSYRSFCKGYGREAADSIIRYYSLVNLMSDTIDFSWEREWRYQGNLKFEMNELFAVIVPNVAIFRRRGKRVFDDSLWKEIERTPIISLEWSYEELLAELACHLWNNFGEE
ncbi:hypothetical protein U2F10_23810 [Leptothoe sp. EHU-05/26/07-4]